MDLHSSTNTQDCLRRSPWALSLLLGLLVAFGLCVASVGTTSGRYMTTGQASVNFLAQAKPTATVTTTESSQDETFQQTLQVTCSRASSNMGVRVRLYLDKTTSYETAPSLTATWAAGSAAYTLSSRKLDSATAAGKDAAWVYIFTDDSGQEVLFSMDDEALDFTIEGDSDISGLSIRAEAVMK